MCACLDFAYETRAIALTKTIDRMTDQIMQNETLGHATRRFHPQPHGNIADAVHPQYTPSICCILHRLCSAPCARLEMLPNAECIIFLFRLANRMTRCIDFDSPPKVLLATCAHQPNRMQHTLHTMCSRRKQDIVRFTSASNCISNGMVFLLNVVRCSVAIHSIYHRAHSVAVALSTVHIQMSHDFAVTKCYTARRQFRQAFECTSIQFSFFVIIFFCCCCCCRGC